MSLVNKLIAVCGCTTADMRRYADLLRADDPKSLNELTALMLKIGKTANDVKQDQSVVRQVIQHQATISAARNTDSQVDALAKEIRAYEEETKRIAAERTETIRDSYTQRAQLLDARDRAGSSINAINDLKATNADLLKDIVVPELSELG